LQVPVRRPCGAKLRELASPARIQLYTRLQLAFSEKKKFRMSLSATAIDPRMHDARKALAALPKLI
jgi:hypothetical protein